MRNLRSLVVMLLFCSSGGLVQADPSADDLRLYLNQRQRQTAAGELEEHFAVATTVASLSVLATGSIQAPSEEERFDTRVGLETLAGKQQILARSWHLMLPLAAVALVLWSVRRRPRIGR